MTKDLRCLVRKMRHELILLYYYGNNIIDFVFYTSYDKIVARTNCRSRTIFS